MGDDGYTLLRKGVTTVTAGTGEMTKPASGETITLWDSGSNNPGANRGNRYKRLGVFIYSSHASAASGLVFQRTNDGTNWRDIVAYSVAATAETENWVAVGATRVRVTYANSANTLTTWEMEVLGDTQERTAP